MFNRLKQAYVAALSKGDPKARIALKLRRFATFKDGWAFGAGRAFAKGVLSDAETLAKVGSSSAMFDFVDVFPGRHGQVVVSFYVGDDEYEYTVDENGVTLREEVGGTVGEDIQLTLREAVERLYSFGTEQWNWSSSWSKMSLIPTKVDSRAHVLNPTLMAQGYLFSTQIALARNQGASALMQTGTTDRPSAIVIGGSTSGGSVSTISSSDNQSWWLTQTPEGMSAIEKFAA